MPSIVEPLQNTRCKTMKIISLVCFTMFLGCQSPVLAKSLVEQIIEDERGAGSLDTTSIDTTQQYTLENLSKLVNNVDEAELQAITDVPYKCGCNQRQEVWTKDICSMDSLRTRIRHYYLALIYDYEYFLTCEAAVQTEHWVDTVLKGEISGKDGYDYRFPVARAQTRNLRQNLIEFADEASVKQAEALMERSKPPKVDQKTFTDQVIRYRSRTSPGSPHRHFLSPKLDVLYLYPRIR